MFPVWLALALATTSVPGPAAAAEAPALVDTAFLSQYVATLGFTLGSPNSIGLTLDGDAVLFLRSAPRSRVHDLCEFDVTRGVERVLMSAEQILAGADERLTPTERARRERLRQRGRGIASYELSRDGRRILVPLSGRLFVIERATGAVTEIRSDASPAETPHFSPDAASVACVRDGDLYVTGTDAGVERRLTRRESATVTNGSAEFVAQEEMDRFDGFWWSPDSKWIAFERADTESLETFHIMDPTHPEQAPESWPYPRPGRRNADVRLGVLPREGGTPVWVNWDRRRYPYLCRVTWTEHAPLTLLVMNRAQTEEALLAADPVLGTTRTLWVERDPAWLNLDVTTPRWLEDGSGFLWTSDRSGPRRLELHGRDGRLRRVLTPPALQVRDVLDAGGERDAVWFTASDDPTEIHVWRVTPEAASAPRRMSTGPGTHRAVFARHHAAYVEAVDPRSGKREWIVRDAGGGERGRLRSIAEPPPFAPRVEYERVGARDLRAAIVRPRDFDPRRKYPVVLNVYGGPTVQTVMAPARAYLVDQLLADQGFVVVSIDGRGTPARGRAWERAIRGDLIGPALADQVDGLRALGRAHRELDLDRVGISGWSFGGYFAAMAVMREPGLFRAAVVGAPVVDWHDYDTFYTERYLGLPGPQAAAYDSSSVLTYVPRLSRPMLVIHGVADDNVYFMHSLKLCAALDAAGKPYEFMPLVGATHLVADPNADRRVHQRTLEFLIRMLGRPVPPQGAAPALP